MRAWNEGLDFHELVLEDPAITGRVPRAKIEHAFDLERQLRNIDKIFARVFPQQVGKRAAAKRAGAKRGVKKRA